MDGGVWKLQFKSRKFGLQNNHFEEKFIWFKWQKYLTVYELTSAKQTIPKRSVFVLVVKAAIIKNYLRMGGLNKQHLFLIVWKAGKSRSRY